ncbi:hypothetical protein PGT21_035326 [Puccinia graminis f. sp. tritici]|uniref:DUF7918 domain-containing protein n=1 Tax=Puccinia graminis f. sp. tritici TaxID=56615 RepID=A0A5B0PZW5_PUCGR|nr:hypothetical protein PGT21_035326 [Puccinia graminis f. sp. tritici]
MLCSPFEISLDIKPNIYLLNHPTMTTTSSYPTNQSLKLNDCLYWIYLDGIEIGWTYTQGPGPHWVDLSTLVSADFSTCRALQFAPVNLVDPDGQDPDPDRSICEDKQVLNSLGIIRVDIFRCNLLLKRFRLADHQDRVDLNLCKTTNQMGFSERSKKALLATTAGLTPDSTQSAFPPPQSTWEVDEEDPHPFLQFIFKYKPRAILEAEGIIPRAGGPAGSSPQSRIIRYVDVDDEISVVKRKTTAKEEKKPNLRENPIEIKSDSESESESESEDQEQDHKKKHDHQKNKRIKRANKQVTPAEIDSKPTSKLQTVNQKTGHS